MIRNIRKLSLGLLIAPALVVGAATYRDEVLSDQPTGYWRLGEATEATVAVNAGSLGAGGDGIPVNGAYFGVAGALTADPDTALYLDGAQSKIEIPYHADLNTPAFTIEAWARVATDSFGHRSPLASRDDPPQRGFIFYADPNNNWQFWTGTGEQVGWNVVGGTFAFVEPEYWTHLVGVYDGTNKFFYVNGVLVGANQSRYTPNGARVLRIGASANESPVGDFFFVGDVDEVAVYPRPLAQERIAAHFRVGSGAEPAADFYPEFAVQPVGAARFKGESLTLTGLATGSLPLNYRWLKDGAEIPGATSYSLTLTNLQPTDTAAYTLEVSNGAGSVLSEPVTLDVADVSRPEITEQPRNRTVLPGSTARLTVAAIGSTFFDYQWFFNDQPLAGATNATLTLTNVQTAQLGTYRVTVSNPAGSTDSDPATIQFPAPATLSYAETVLQDHPAGYWRLGETEGEVAEDAAGENDGFYLNGVTLGRPGALADDTNPAAGFSAEFQTKVDINWSGDLNSTEFTIECWARVTGGDGGYRSPLTSRADFPQRGYIFYAGPNNAWQFWTGTGEQVGWNNITGPAVVNDTWTYLVATYDGTTKRFYVDGVEAGSSTTPFAINDENPLRIGAGATEGDGTFFFEGDIDEVAVYSSALSEERILAHYVAGFPLTTPPSIVTQPVSRTVPPGATVSFSVAATGGQPLAYQWLFDDTPLASATESSLVLENVSSAQVGGYSVIVSNAGGNVTSLVATLTIPPPPTRPYSELVRAANPVAYWRLGESTGEVAQDELEAHPGSYLNGVTLGVPGAIGGDSNTAVRFSSAASQKIDVPWSDALNSTEFTAEFWARVTGGQGGYRSPLTSRADTPQRGYIFYAAPNNTWQFWTGRGDSSGWDSIVGPAVVNEAWTHLVATYDGTTKRFYVNGVEVGSSTGAFGPNDEHPLRIGGGASEGDGNFFFEGDVDEVAVYRSALTTLEVIEHFLAGAPVVEPLVLHFSRDGSNLVLTWSAGTLQSANTLSGQWATVEGATSPLTVSLSEEARFYRVQR